MQQFLLHHHPPSITTCTATNFRLLPSPISLPKSIGILSPVQQLVAARTVSYWGRCTIKCMATPRRVKMVAKQIRRELSDMLLTDKVLQFAILPETALGADRYLSSITTISDVVVSGDLQVVKVYVSVFGDERGKELAISGLKSKAKYVRSELGKRMKLRLTPEIRFIEDESLERGSRIIAILDKIKEENEEKMAKGQTDDQFQSSDQENDEEDLDEDDVDEDGIFYVK